MNLRDEIKARMSKNTEVVDSLSLEELNFVHDHMMKMNKVNGTYEIELSRDYNNETLSINLNYGSTFISK